MLELDAATHEYRFGTRKVPGVNEIIRSALGDPFERVARDVLEHALQRGKAVHKACELDDAGELDEATLDPRIVPYVEAWRAFRRQFGFRVLFAETALYSKSYGFAGTPDVIAAVDDAPRYLMVIDRKSGLPGPAAALQTAAYATLFAENHGTTVPRRFALQMKPNGKYAFPEYDNPRDWRDFLACLAVHRLKEKIANG